MRQETKTRLVKAAKFALRQAGLKEITTERQSKNGTTAWRCDKSGYEFSEYESGYIRRQSVPSFYKGKNNAIYQINPRYSVKETLPSELIWYQGKMRRLEERVEETSEFEMIEDQHSRLLYMLAFYVRNKDRFIHNKHIKDIMS
jgi:hypothetical protein